jgi:ABC-type antimicrobial peptide transport system permease subunit
LGDFEISQSQNLKINFMFKNYFKTAWRNIKHYKTASIINIVGLSIGMAAAVLIFMWVQNEMNFDNYHPQSNRIYYVKMGHEADVKKFAGTPLLLADAIKQQVPDVQETARLLVTNKVTNPVLNINNNFYKEKELVFADAAWFDIFHYRFIEGNANAFGENPNSIILTESLAKKYFGNKEATEQIIHIDSAMYKVQGVIKDNPSNSSFQYNIFLPLDAYLKTSTINGWASWLSFNFQTFIKSKPNASPNIIEQKINKILLNEEQLRTAAFSNGQKDTITANLTLLKDLHFDDSIGADTFKQGNKQVVLIFSILGCLLLLIACINYVNLTTAKASERSKEVSIRKITGAGRKTLFIQFMSESVITGIIALLITLLIVWQCIPWFNNFTEKNFVFSLASVYMWKIIAGTLSVTILLTGIYPAILLSSFKPLIVLKGFTVLRTKNSGLRKILVTSQFTIAIVLAISTVIILDQLHFIQSNKEGYNRSQIFSFSLPKDWNKNNNINKADFVNVIKTELAKQPAIENIAVASDALFNIKMSMGGIADWSGKKKDEEPMITPLSVDADFRKIFKLQLKEGRWFESGNINDMHNYILNETAIEKLGLKKPYVGQYFALFGDTGKIIGVVKDFHFRDYRHKIDASVLFNNPGLRSTFFIQAHGANMKKALSTATKTWKKFFPQQPFDYSFLDEEFAQIYSTDIKTSKLIGLFAGIAIFISCLGLLGLVSFVAEQRTKEISIRKVLGASVAQVVALLSKDFVKLVLIAVVIASPVAWFAMNKWLEDFAYRINISWWIFIAVGFFALLIALITVSFQSIKAAIANPVKSLRTE